jgi:hypothetical protein
MRLDFQIGTGKGGTQQDESRRSILGEVSYGIARIELAGAE